MLYGQQAIAKFNEQARNLVNIYLAVVRLPDQDTEILISMNQPVVISQGSSSGQSVTAPAQPAVGVQVFEAIVSSFTIVDFGLFGASA